MFLEENRVAVQKAIQFQKFGESSLTNGTPGDIWKLVKNVLFEIWLQPFKHILERVRKNQNSGRKH